MIEIQIEDDTLFIRELSGFQTPKILFTSVLYRDIIKPLDRQT